MTPQDCGIFLAGCGYTTWHGVPHGENHEEGERWSLAGSDALDVASIQTNWYDQPARFEMAGETWIGIVEAGFSRNLAKHYQPTF